MEVRWGIFWRGEHLRTGFYEGLSYREPRGTLWSMEIAYDLIPRIGCMIVVDVREEEGKNDV